MPDPETWTQPADRYEPVTGQTADVLAGVAAAVSAQVVSLQLNWPRELKLAGRRRSPSFVRVYPYFFAQAFSAIEDTALRDLGLALHLLAESMGANDSLYDSAPGQNKVQLSLTGQVLQYEAYRVLNKLFPAECRFWGRFQVYFAEYASSCLRERELARSPGAWEAATVDVFTHVARKKASLARCVVAGLAQLTGEERLIGILTDSVEHGHLGLQYLDDLTDWREDLEKGSPTPVLRRLLSSRPAFTDAEALRTALSRCAIALYSDGVAKEVLVAARTEFDRAYSLTQSFPLHNWHDRLSVWRRNCDTMVQEIAATVHR